MAVTPEEQELAHQAERLADHAVDLTFADALRQAADETPDETPEMKERVASKQKAQAAVEADAARIKTLTDSLATARADARAGLQDQIDVARAQQELDQDELDMAAESLERTGGDPQAEIKRLKALHDAAQKDIRPSMTSAAAVATPSDDSLLARLRAWNALLNKRAQIAEAEQDAKDRVQRQTKRRAAIVQRIREAGESREAAQKSAAGFTQRAAGEGEASKQEARTTVEKLKQFRDDQQRVTTIGRRIQDQEALADVYDRWGALVRGYARAALHRLLEGLLLIALVLVVTFLATRLVDRLYEGVAREQLRAATLQSVVKFAVQVVGVLIVLFIVSGCRPGNHHSRPGRRRPHGGHEGLHRRLLRLVHSHGAQWHPGG